MKINYGCILLLFCLTGFIQTNAQDKSAVVYLSGKINYLDNQVQVEDMSEMKDLKLPSNERIFIPDSVGNFSVKFVLKESNYFRIGRNILYLSPGDRLEMSIDFDYPEKSSFKGKAAPINEYLKFTPYPSLGSFLDGEVNIKPTIQETINAIIAISKEKEKQLDTFKGISKELKKLEHVRIKADVIIGMYSIYPYYPHVHKIKKDSLEKFFVALHKAIDPYIEQYSKQIFSDSYLKLEVYRLVVSNISDKATNRSTFSPQIKDWLTGKQIVEKVKIFNYKDSIIALEPSAKKIKTAEYRNAVFHTINQSLKFRNGDLAKNFIAADSNNKPIELNSFAGKVIFIDIWATWCGPCVEEMPYLDSLREKYKNNPDIVFISLSIDEDKEAWRKKLLALKATGIQCNIDRLRLFAYDVPTIPRTIIIDKNFKVVEMNGPLPSSVNTKKIIDDLLQ